MKYLMLRREDQDLPICFPDCLNHDAVATALIGQLVAVSRARVVSAGACDLVVLSTAQATIGAQLAAATTTCD